MVNLTTQHAPKVLSQTYSATFSGTPYSLKSMMLVRCWAAKKWLSYRIITIELCLRCQHFNHSPHLCTLNFICVKCSGNHLSKGLIGELIKCGNCFANYSYCPKITKVISADIIVIEEASARQGISFAAAGSNTCEIWTLPTFWKSQNWRKSSNFCSR